MRSDTMAKMIINKSIVVNNSVKEVYEYVRFIKNQDRFSVWNMADPKMQKTYSGEDGEIGFIYEWDSKNKNVGAGAQEIVKLKPNKLVACEIRFERPMEQTSQSNFELESIAKDKTKLSWVFIGESKFPANVFSFIVKRILGKDMQTGLINAKMNLER